MVHCWLEQSQNIPQFYRQTIVVAHQDGRATEAGAVDLDREVINYAIGRNAEILARWTPGEGCAPARRVISGCYRTLALRRCSDARPYRQARRGVTFGPTFCLAR